MKLPIDDYLSLISATMLAKQNVLIQSSPGSGKTTRIPPYLSAHFKNIIIVEPRRIAAIYAASRIAEEKNWPLGQNVGYEVRFDSKKSSTTQILFLTEALLAKKIASDPNLENIDLIIFDEFHERSYWTDLAIGHLKELQILGSQIKLLFLSATIDKVPLTAFFDDMGIIEIELPRFPIETIYQKKPFRFAWNSELDANLLMALIEIVQKGKKQILVFLPGLKEIRNASRAIETSGKFKKFATEVLHGSVPLAVQKGIVANENGFEFRIILSTNIAESSLTISGVTAVLDSGLHRDASFNADYEETQLQTKKISQFSAIQRQGRANRLGPGICYKMWSDLDEKSMEKSPIADIKKSSLFELGLHLVKMGHWPLSQFTWFETPSPTVLAELENRYLEYGLAFDKSLTSLGELVLDLGLSYENAWLLILSSAYYSLDKAALLIALLESDFSAPDSNHSVHSTLLEAVDFFNRNRTQHVEISKRILQIKTGFEKSQLYRNWQIESKKVFKTPVEKTFIEFLEKNKKSDKALDLIIAFSYRFRICKRRKQEGDLSHKAATTNSKEIRLGDHQKSNQLPQIEYFLNFKTVIDATQTARCFSFHFVPTEVFDIAVRPSCQKITRVEFVESKQQFYKVVELGFCSLVIDTLTYDPLDPAELKEKTKDIFLAQLDTLVLSIPAINELMIRIELVSHSTNKEIKYPWDQMIETELKKGLTLKNRMDWNFELEGYLPYEEQRIVKELVPSELQIKVLSRTFKIHYSRNETPSIESRLQHFLGLNQHPAILGGQLKLKVILLGPHGRPIQITNDLPSFWKTSYPEIRKEMRGRYPKHPWPEDPTSFSN